MGILELKIDEELTLRQYSPSDSVAIFDLISRNREHLHHRGGFGENHRRGQKSRRRHEKGAGHRRAERFPIKRRSGLSKRVPPAFPPVAAQKRRRHRAAVATPRKRQAGAGIGCQAHQAASIIPD